MVSIAITSKLDLNSLWNPSRFSTEGYDFEFLPDSLEPPVFKDERYLVNGVINLLGLDGQRITVQSEKATLVLYPTHELGSFTTWLRLLG